MGFSSYKSYGSRIAIPNILLVVPPPAAPSAPVYTFRIKASSSTVPTNDFNGIAITNTGGVTIVNNPIRGYVFNLSGTNYLGINVNESSSITRTFWLSTSTPESGSGNVYSSNNFPVFFGGSNRLFLQPNYPSGGTITSSLIQNTTWVFYAITISPSSMSLYLNGSLIADKTVNENWDGDSSQIQFGAYVGNNNYKGLLDDMRLYPSILTSEQIRTIYNEPVVITPAYTFRIKGNNTTAVPTNDFNGSPITNHNGVTMFNDPIRGYVFKFLGENNYSSIDKTTPAIFTRTFWVSTPSPQISLGNIFTNKLYPIFFGGDAKLNIKGDANEATFQQTSAWTHYGIVQNTSTINLYINGNLTQTFNDSYTDNASTSIFFGAYSDGFPGNYTGLLDDLRQYSSALTSDQILTIYNQPANSQLIIINISDHPL